MNGQARWICCQLGAREHYAVPRALHRDGRLALLVTDAWAPPGSAAARIPGSAGARLRERFEPDLNTAQIADSTRSLIAHEIWWRLQGRTAWDLVVTRNEWFQQRAATAVRAPRVAPGAPTIVFAHSYAARAQFREAKARGFSTVLGQIDPGEEHFHTIARLAGTSPDYGQAPAAPPSSYFDSWREECALADRIMVNSEWSRQALERVGVSAAKLAVVPLPYEPDAASAGFSREYPAEFSRTRPLRALFVGSAAVAKGVPALLEAVDLVGDTPVELSLVGPIAMTVPPRYLAHRAIRWVGPVSRSDVMAYYRQSDVLVFPSLSDGFGMAQVEAQGWRLPIIASRFCGRVVHDGVTGVLLHDVSPEGIARALTTVAADPQLLAGFSRNAGVTPQTDLSALGAALRQLERS